MSINAGSRIVPWVEANALMRGALGSGVELPEDEYARVQLLTREGAESLVFEALAKSNDFGVFVYGALAQDFPLCADFARAAVALILMAAVRLGLAVRPYFFRLHYTKHNKTRHAICGVLLADGSVAFLEPQGVKWLETPADAAKLDRVKL